MLFNSKFLIKWKDLLEAREQQLQQDSAWGTDSSQKSTSEEGGWQGSGGADLSVSGLVRVGRRQGSGCTSFLLSPTGLEKCELVCPSTGENLWRRRDFRSTTCL